MCRRPRGSTSGARPQCRTGAGYLQVHDVTKPLRYVRLRYVMSACQTDAAYFIKPLRYVTRYSNVKPLSVAHQKAPVTSIHMESY